MNFFAVTFYASTGTNVSGSNKKCNKRQRDMLGRACNAQGALHIAIFAALCRN
jgi:hypothetical protein